MLATTCRQCRLLTESPINKMHLDISTSTKFVDYRSIGDIDGASQGNQLFVPLALSKSDRTHRDVVLFDFDRDMPFATAQVTRSFGQFAACRA